MTKRTPANGDKIDHWQGVKDVIHRTAPRPITKDEAHEAALNLLQFCRLALEIRQESMQHGRHDSIRS